MGRKDEQDHRTAKEFMDHPRNWFEEVAARAMRRADNDRLGQRKLFDPNARPTFPTSDGEPPANGPEDVGARTERPPRGSLRMDPPRWDTSDPPDRVPLEIVQQAAGLVQGDPGSVQETASDVQPEETFDVTPALIDRDQARESNPEEVLRAMTAEVPSVAVEDVDTAALPQNTGTTGWHLLRRVDRQIFGLDFASHQALDIVRLAPAGLSGRQTTPVTRLWTSKGEIAGLSNGHRTAGQPEKGLLMADDAGVALLLKQLPFAPPPGTSLEDQIQFYPFSVVKWIAVAVGLEELCAAANWACRREAIKARGGIPVLGLARDDFEGLARVVRPPGVGLLVRDVPLLRWIDEEMWGTKVERGGWGR